MESVNSPKNKLKQRTLLIFGIASFIACFQWAYLQYLNPVWEYFGYEYNPPQPGYLLLAWVLSILPTLWMPLQLTRPSQFAYWMLYLTVFIPSMFVPLYIGMETALEVSILMVTLFVGFCIVGLSNVLPLLHFRERTDGRKFWAVFVAVGSLLAIWLVVIFRHHFQIVSFAEIYDLRERANDVMEGSQVNYAIMLLSGAVNPFLMGSGLYTKRRWMYLLGAFGQILVFSVSGAKSVLLSIFFIPGLYVLINFPRLVFGIKMTLAALVLFGVPCLTYYVSDYNPEPLHDIALSVVLQRTWSSGGLSTAQYFDFFERNPRTYYSHIKGVNLFVPYPYRYPVGQEIGIAYAGTTDLDATAHLWATDGIAAFGLPGVLLVSVICGLVFWVLDSAARHHDPGFAALVISFVALDLANISIFTTLLSGGLAFLILVFFMMPPFGTFTREQGPSPIPGTAPIRG